MGATSGLCLGMALLALLMAGGGFLGSTVELPTWLEDASTALVVGFVAAALLVEVAPTLATSRSGVRTGLTLGGVFLLVWAIDRVAARLSHGGPVGFAVAVAINFFCDGILLYIMARGSRASTGKFALLTLLLAVDNVILVTLLAARNRGVAAAEIRSGDVKHLATVVVPALVFFASPLLLAGLLRICPAAGRRLASQEKTFQAAAAGALAYALVGELVPAVPPNMIPIAGASLGGAYLVLRSVQ